MRAAAERSPHARGGEPMAARATFPPMALLEAQTRADRWRRDGPAAFARLHPRTIVAAAGLALLAAPWLWTRPAGEVAIAATALVLVGVPHGAVDHRVARPLLRPRLHPRLRPAWFAVFSGVYLGVSGAILLGWWVAPALSLVAFLVVSTLHFGTEDAEGRGLPAMLARGGAPIALAILLHPERTGRFFATLGGTEDAMTLLAAAAWAWVPVMGWHAARLLRTGPAPAARRELAEVAAVVVAFAALPPLVAFAFYFLVVHSPRHMAELARRHAGDDASQGWRWALARSVPLSLMTFALGAALFWSLDGTLEERFLRTTYWGLAALTVPHMILHHLDRRAGGARLT